MSTDALLRTARALKARIEAAPEVGQDRVVLGAPPLAGARLDGPRLGLFLYRLEPTADLRNRPRRPRPTVPGQAAAEDGGLPLDLRFLLTAYGPEDETGLGVEQLILLGGALRALEAGPILGEDSARVGLDPLSSEELSRIWSLFPNTSYQTSVGVLVTPVWIGLGVAVPAAPVTGGRFGFVERGG